MAVTMMRARGSILAMMRMISVVMRHRCVRVVLRILCHDAAPLRRSVGATLRCERQPMLAVCPGSVRYDALFQPRPDVDVR
jgi:hypothetical protein